MVDGSGWAAVGWWLGVGWGCVMGVLVVQVWPGSRGVRWAPPLEREQGPGALGWLCGVAVCMAHRQHARADAVRPAPGQQRAAEGRGGAPVRAWGGEESGNAARLVRSRRGGSREAAGLAPGVDCCSQLQPAAPVKGARMGRRWLAGGPSAPSPPPLEGPPPPEPRAALLTLPVAEPVAGPVGLVPEGRKAS